MAGPTLGTAYVQIVASAQGMRGAVASALNGEARTAGASAGSLIGSGIKKALVAAGIGAALVGGFKAAIAETGQLQQSYLGGLDTLYGDAADKAREYARAAQEAGVSQSNFSEQAVSFGAALRQAYGGDTTQALEAANMAILDMTDNAAKMGTPLESIQQAYQGFARGQYQLLDNLKLGYGGTKGEMERLLADAEKITGIHYDIDNLGDVYNAIHVIQGELGLTGVAAEEAKSTLTGSFEGMKAAWQNLIGNIGLGENVESSMKTFTEAMSNYFFNNLIPTIGTIIKSLPTAIGTFIQTGLPQLASAGMVLVKSLADGAKTGLPTMIENMVTSLGNLSGQILKGANSFVNVGLGLIQKIAQGIINSIPTFIQTAPKIITNFANIINQNAPKIIATGFSILKALAVGLIKAIPVLVQSIPQIFKAFLAVWEAINWLSLGKLAITGIVKGISAVGGLVKAGMNKVKEFMLAPIRTAVNFIKGFISGFKSAFDFSAVVSKVSSAFNRIKERMLSPIKGARDTIKGIVNKIKGFFPFNIGKIINLKVPSISLSTGSKSVLGKTITYPKGFNVSWHDKAMNNPYLFDSATLFGAGETGDEVLYGRNALMRDISEAVGNGGATITNYITVNGADDPEDWARRLVREMKLEMRSI